MAIGSSSPAPALISCKNCPAKNTFEKMLTEREIAPDIAEGILVCPDCGQETHCYYMSPELRTAQASIFATVASLSENITQEKYNEIVRLREKYKNIFDGEQDRIKKLLEKEHERSAY